VNDVVTEVRLLKFYFCPAGTKFRAIIVENVQLRILY